MAEDFVLEAPDFTGQPSVDTRPQYSGGPVTKALQIQSALDQGVDIRSIMPVPESGGDAIDAATEAELAKLGILEQVIASGYYSPRDFTTPAARSDEDPGFVQRLTGVDIGGEISDFFTSQWGRDLPDDQKAAIKRILSEKDRRSSWFAQDRYGRMMGEARGETPTRAERLGVPPKDILKIFEKYPYMLNIWQEGTSPERTIELTQTVARIAENEYGVTPVRSTDPESPDYIDPEVLKKSRDLITWLPQIENLVPGVVEDTLGPALVADWNSRYGTQYTVSDFDLKTLKIGGDERIVFRHPISEKHVPIDSFNLGWDDLIDLVPDAMVIGADVAGTVTGAAAGAVTAGPGGAVAGGMIVGALSTGYAAWKNAETALRKADFRWNAQKGGWEKGDTFVDGMDLFFNALPEASMSAGGNLAGSLFYKLYKRLTLGKGTGIEDVISPQEFTNAWNDWQATSKGAMPTIPGRSGIVPGQFAEMPRLMARDLEISPTSAMVYERWGQMLRNAAGAEKNATKRRKYEQRASMVEREAAVLRKAEERAGTTTLSPRDAVYAESRASVLRQTPTKMPLPGVTVAPEITEQTVKTADPAALGTTVTRQLQRDLTGFERAISKIVETNRTILDDIGQRITSGVESGAALAQQLKVIQEKVIADTSKIYDDAATELGSRTPFDPTSVRKSIDQMRSLRGKGGGPGALPSDVVAAINRQIGRVGQIYKGGKWVDPPPGSKISVTSGNVNYGTWKSARDLITEAWNKSTNTTQKTNLLKLRNEWDEVLIQGAKDVNPKLAETFKNVNALYTGVQDTWVKGALKNLNPDQSTAFFKKLFDTQDAGFVDKFMSNIWPQLDETQQKLFRTAFQSRYLNTVGSQSIPKEIAEQSGKFTTVEGTAIPLTTLSQGERKTFERGNRTWIDALFPKADDGTSAWDEMVSLSTSVGKTQADIRSYRGALKELVELPWFKNKNMTVNEFIINMNSPQKIIDEVFEAGGDPAGNMKQLLNIIRKLPNKSAKGTLSPQAKAIHDLRVLTFRRIFNSPERASISKGVGLGGTETAAVDANQMAITAIRELSTNRSAYDQVYGKKHVGNMINVFKVMDNITKKPTTPGRVTTGGAEFGSTFAGDLGLSALKVYVGVLNRRARALTLGKKLYTQYLGSNIDEMIADPGKLAKALKAWKTPFSRKTAPSVLASALGVKEIAPGDLEELYDILERPDMIEEFVLEEPQ